MSNAADGVCTIKAGFSNLAGLGGLGKRSFSGEVGGESFIKVSSRKSGKRKYRDNKYTNRSFNMFHCKGTKRNRMITGV